MKRFIISSAVIILLTTALIYGKQKVGDIRPALLPVKNTPNSDLNSEVDYLKTPDGYKIGIFAYNLDSPRDLEFSPNGSLLASVPSQGKVVALIDKDKDGKSDSTKEVISKLVKPHGLAFYNNKLFIAEETQVSRYFWDEQNLEAKLDAVLFSIPKGGRHVTRSITFNKNGKMFVSIGSSCDVCFENHEWLAAVVVSDSEGKNPKPYAIGLRNSVFITINPKTNELWGTEMGRDFLGDNLPPDEINIIKENKNHGWPLCYGNKVHDREFDKNFDKELVFGNKCAGTEAPVYEIPAHSAPLGLTFIDSTQFPVESQGDLLTAYHGSWNRSSPVGYKVVKLNVEDNKVTGEEDFITGFVKGSEPLGRPVDLVFDKDGSLYLSDDKAGVIYKIVKR